MSDRPKVPADQVLRDYRDADMIGSGACNISGIVISFAEILKRMCADPDAYDIGPCTTSRNEHPICRLIIEQLQYLSGGGGGDLDTYSKAYEAVRTKIADMTAEQIAANQAA